MQIAIPLTGNQVSALAGLLSYYQHVRSAPRCSGLDIPAAAAIYEQIDIDAHREAIIARTPHVEISLSRQAWECLESLIRCFDEHKAVVDPFILHYPEELPGLSDAIDRGLTEGC